MSEETNEALEQIESEIKETQRKAGQEEDFEIEIVAEELGKPWRRQLKRETQMPS